jgi:hypothetical protein
MPASDRHSSCPSAHDISRLPWAALICVAVLLSGVALARARARDGVPSGGVNAAIGDISKANEKPSTGTQLREGSELLDERGYFKQVRDRLMFLTADGKRQMVTLENLALERVQRSVSDNPTQQDWIVWGTVTEFRGVNYLLLRRAILTPRAQLPRER